MRPLLGLLVSTLAGAAVVWCVLPAVAGGRREAVALERCVRLLLAVALGIALSSGVHMATLVAGSGSRAAWRAGELSMAVAGLAALVVARHRGTSAVTDVSPRADTEAPSWLRTWAGVVLAAAVILAALGVMRRAPFLEHGFWDAWAMVNLRARFLFAGGAQWDGVFSPHLAWIPRDYPLMVPASVARLWTWAGDDSPAVPQAFALFVAAALLALLYTAVRAVRGPLSAAVAGMALLGTPWYLEQSLYQVVDLPLALLVLATVVSLDRAAMAARPDGDWALTGAFAASAAWAKNEGLVFAGLMLAGILLLARAHGVEVRWRALGLGALPFAALVVTYKSVVAGTTYFLEHQTVPGLLARLTDPSRHALVWRFVGETLWSAPWFLVMAALVVAYALAAGPARGGESRRATAAIGLVLGLQAAAYLAVYLISPRDLAWHVTSSGSRIALHVWPALLFWLMLSVGDGTRATR